MHTAVVAVVEKIFPPYERTAWDGFMHRACAEEHGNRVVRDVQDQDVLIQGEMVCVHCDGPLNPKED